MQVCKHPTKNKLCNEFVFIRIRLWTQLRLLGLKITLLVVFLLSLFFSCIHLNALQIEPLRTITSVEAGIENKGSIKLTNEKKIPVSVEIELIDLSKQRGLVEHDWLKLGSFLLELEPGQQMPLEYSIFLPKESSGEYPARIAFTEKPAGTSDQSMIAINTRVSVPFYATIKGTEVYDIRIADFDFDNDSRNEATVTLQNAGNVHVRPVGQCFIKSEENDDLLQSTTINDDGYPIRPESEQKFKVRFNKSFQVGTYVAELEFKPFKGHSESICKTFKFDLKAAH